jgi:hypothetical protein
MLVLLARAKSGENENKYIPEAIIWSLKFVSNRLRSGTNQPCTGEKCVMQDLHRQPAGDYLLPGLTLKQK